jgi:hypothetical protein
VPNAAVVYGSGYAGSHVSAGADGRFEILGLPRASYSVAAREGDRASPIARVDVRTADVSDVRLAIADATISGVVVDTQGEPVAEAQVDAMPDGQYIAIDGSTRAVTDSHGRWTIGPLSSEAYRLRADWPDTGQDNTYNKPDVATAKPGDRDVKIVLPAAGTIRGVVVRGGAPVTRYAIAVGEGRVSPFLTPKIIAHADGRFERAGLPPGTYELAIAGADFALTTVKDIEVKAGEVKDIGTVSVGDGRSVHGSVVDHDGAPVAGATVACALYFLARDGGIGLDDDPMKRAMMNQRVATSGADGSFTVLALAMDQAPKHPPKCLADKPGVGRSAATPLPEDAAAPITLTLAGTGAIVVTVENANDEQGVSVEATPVGGEMGTHAFGGQSGVRLEGLVPGSYAVRASTMSRGMRSTPPVTVEVRSGETTPATVTFALGAVTLVVEGTCQYAMLMPPGEGEPDWRSSLAGAQCEKDGKTEIPDIAPGDYRLCATGDCIPVTVTASPPRQTVRLP